MRVVVAVPWRDGPGRAKWFEVVKRHYATHFSDWELVTVDAGGEQFQRAASRNKAVAIAKARGADVVVINDADTVVRSGALRDAVVAAAKGGLHLPFETCVVLKGAHANAFAAQVGFPKSGGFASTGGVYVVRPDQWEAFGGSDEHFRGWGGEDDQVAAAAETLVGLHRHPGVAVSLGHDGERLANPFYAENMLRVRMYQEAAAHPEMMRTVIAHRHELIELARSLPPRVAVIAPSRGRPENIARLWQSIRDTALLQVDLLVGLDEDDAASYPRIDGVNYFVKPRQRLNAWWNDLALQHVGQYETFVFAGDDNVMVTPGWDFLLDDELARHNYTGFATGPDGLRKDKKFTWAAIGARQIHEVGYVGPEGLIHLCIDTAWQYLAQATNTMYWLDHVLIEHLHYSRSGAGVAEDQTYREANAREVNRKDHETVNAWGSSVAFKRAVATIKKLLTAEYPGAPRLPFAEGEVEQAPPGEGAPEQSVALPFQVVVGGQMVHEGRIVVPVELMIEGGQLQLRPVGNLAELIRGAL